MYTVEAVLDKNISLGGLVPADEFLDHDQLKKQSAQFIARALFNNCPELVDNQPYHSLLDALKASYNGDERAKSLVQTNVETDVIERTIKAGFVSRKVCLDIDDSGSISQHGQSLASVQANSLASAQQHDVMFERTKAEHRNALRLERLNKLGVLDDYSMVVFSLAEDLPEFGFYTETMSCSIQLITKENDDQLSLESAFVAGKQQDVQFDKSVITSLYKHLANVDISGFTAAQIIDLPLLVPRSMLANGVIDLVKEYDDINKGSFFGLNQSQQDYEHYKWACHERLNNYNLTIKTIVSRLINEAYKFKDVYEASQRLGQLSHQYTLIQAIEDNSIDPNVFGQTASRHIIQARIAWMHGDDVRFIDEFSLAQKLAVSSSCPSIVGLGRTNSLKNDSGVEDEYGSLEFVCPNGHLNTREKGQLIDNCQVCGISVRC